MTKPSFSSPLRWPAGYDRTRRDQRLPASHFRVSGGTAVDDFVSELSKLRATNIVVTSEMPRRQDGLPYASNDLRTDDPGVAVYCRRRDQDLVFACDRYASPLGNMRGLTLAFEAMRAIERHGSKQLADKALGGFAALPAQAGQTVTHWSIVLGMAQEYESYVRSLSMPQLGDPRSQGRVGSDELLDLAQRRHRALAREIHPDKGASHEATVVLNVALEDAKRELS